MPNTQHKLKLLNEIEDAKIYIDTRKEEIWQDRVISLILEALFVLLTDSIKKDREGR